MSLSDAERDKWKEALKSFVHCVAAMRNRRIILKSPTHTARVKTLLEVFPDARFVHIVRDPLALFPSTIRLWTTLSQVQGLQTVDDGIPWVERQVLDTFARMYERFEQDRDLIPAGHLAEVRYEELVADPVGQMQSVYEQLNLGGYSKGPPRDPADTPTNTATTAPAATPSHPPPPNASAATGRRTSNATATPTTRPTRRHRRNGMSFWG